MSNVTRAADFVNSMGINIHAEYTDGGYANAGAVLSALNYLGIHNLRDGAVSSRNQGQATYGTLANAGYKFDMLVQSGRDPGEAVGSIAGFAAAHPGSISAIEGLNEINNWHASFAGLTGTAAAVAFQSALATSIHATPGLAGTALYAFTGAFAASDADYANFHAYAQAGAQPLGSLTRNLASMSATAGSKPAVLTEAGYYTAAANGAWCGVDEATQAKLTLNLFLDASKVGIARTYVYQLLDAYTDATGVDPDKHLGLFDLSYHAKPAATAIHDLTTILADSSATAGSFATSALAFTVAGLPTGGASMDMEKASGVHDIVLWAEPDIWDETAHKAIAAATADTTVDFGTNHVSVAVYDPLVSDKAIATYADVTSVHVGVQDHPVIVEVTDIPDPVAPRAVATAPAPTALLPVAPTILTGGPGNDQFTVIDSGTRIVEKAGQGTDTVTASVDYVLDANVERLVLTGTAHNGTGNALGNIITGSDAGGVLSGLDGNDQLHAGAGATKLLGGNGDDQLYGGNGNDLLDGGAGADLLQGGAGDDTLSGGAGQDKLVGGPGQDVLTGGGGADKFVFTNGDFAGPTLPDTITDFVPTDGDKIYLNGMDANTNTAAIDHFSFIGDHAFTGLAGQLRYAVSATGVTLMGDTNGDGVADFAIALIGQHQVAAGWLVL